MPLNDCMIFCTLAPHVLMKWEWPAVELVHYFLTPVQVSMNELLYCLYNARNEFASLDHSLLPRFAIQLSTTGQLHSLA